MADQTSNAFDVLIIGAGISGINAAYRLQEQTPDRTYAILEARHSIGGTWDLFKYPGIRSDSDLHTFGFPFRPWEKENAIADGQSIKSYMEDTMHQFGIDQHILYHHKLLSANWSTDGQHWGLSVDHEGTKKQFHAKFVIFCTGYYDYNEALPAKIPGIDNFQGQVIHPQFWPEDLDYQDKDIVIIGSGATAITLLPNLAKGGAGHVTMLQRSPTYIVALPQVNKLAYWTRRILPLNWALKVIRFQSIVLPFLFFKFCQAFPERAKRGLEKGVRAQLPEGYPIDPDFKPSYNPWDQRLCVSPDGDFYECLRHGKSSIVTANIKQVNEKSIHLKDSDKVLTPDIIITATGLKIMVAGGAKLSVDNEEVHVPQKHLWKGVMLEDVPNAAFAFGYTNASWTLGSDASAQFVTRLLNKMKRDNITQAVAKVDRTTGLQDRSIFNLTSTYVKEAEGDLPKAGDRAPWLRRSHYLRDLWEARYGDMSKEMIYSRIST
ncbi:hypothetical protein AAFC00_006205 [Neodothiora populina]|uniref:Monooxygenase n=1 Tax=Neodothiora populina TaxID=2781224 RepID=A0ABR3P4Q8_9PEZI